MRGKRTKTVSPADKLKRLARDYANAKVDFSWEGYTSDGGDDDELLARDRYRDARRKLHDAIDEVVRQIGYGELEEYP